MVEPVPAEPEVLVARVRRAVQESGLTQQAFANAIDMDPTALSKVLSGRRRPSTLELALIAEVTGVSVTEVLAGAERGNARISARVQPDASPAVDRALSRVGDLLEIEALLGDLQLPALPSRFPLTRGQGSAVRQAAELARETRELAGAGD